MKENTILCANCYTMSEYTVKTEKATKVIDGKEYSYIRKYGVCNNCNSEIFVPGLEEMNHNALNDAYRKVNNIVTINEIEQIMDKYEIDKRPLSLVLGFGEITIKRYMDGSVPSGRYSAILKRVLENPLIMKSYLENNKEKISGVAYKKTATVLSEMEEKDSYDTKIELVACYIRDSGYEISDMSLQKLLYYAQGVNLIVNNQVIFSELCQAWKHGPVYPVIYDKYKNYGADIIPPCELCINYDDLLDKKERDVIDLVLHSFGRYNGSVLRNFTHKEDPWLNERVLYEDDEICTNEISIDSMREYFTRIDKQFNLSTEDGIQNYITSLRAF